ncbi:MAG: acyltransferase [Aestuariivirga sp.]
MRNKLALACSTFLGKSLDMSEEMVMRELRENPFDRHYFLSGDLREMGFKGVGDNVIISKNCTIIGLHNITLGNNVRIDDNVIISASSGSLAIGNYIHVAAACYLNCAGGLMLLDFAGLSQGVRIYSSSDDYSGHFMTNPTVPSKFIKLEIAPVAIGRHAIVGSGSVILPGVTIGEGAAVGALSVVNTHVNDWNVFGGVPARKIGMRSKDLLMLEAQLLEAAKR